MSVLQPIHRVVTGDEGSGSKVIEGNGRGALQEIRIRRVESI